MNEILRQFRQREINARWAMFCTQWSAIGVGVVVRAQPTVDLHLEALLAAISHLHLRIAQLECDG